MSTVIGWGIKDTRTGEVSVATVSPTRRAAIVNWLVAACRVPIADGMRDGLIETIWNKHSQEESRARVVMVRIEEIGK